MSTSLPGTMRETRARGVRKVVLGLVGLGLFVALWESYKAFGRAVDDHVFGFRLWAHTDDASMPHLWTVMQRFGDPEIRDRPRTVFQSVAAGCWYSFRLATVGFLVGVLVGMALAIVMQRLKLARQAWLPFIVLSQTVPLIALAPLVVGWGGNWRLGSWEWEKWMSVAGMSAYLAFFPVAIGALRGLQSPQPHSEELMRSYAASWRQTLFKLRLPSAMPYLIPALRLAAAAAVVGAIVAEISAGVTGGVGRLILDYFQKATGDPAQVFTAFVGAAALGVLVAGLITLFEAIVMRNRSKESVA